MLQTWTAGPRLSIIGAYTIEGCDGLERVPGLPDLTRLGRLRIADNESLSSLAGFTASRSGHPTVDRVEVTGNPRLPAVAVDQLLDRMHLPSSADAVVVEGNGTAMLPPSEAGDGTDPAGLQQEQSGD